MTAARLHAEDVSVKISGRTVLDTITLTAEPGEVVGIVGPNGSGKSTLLRTLVKLLPPCAGSIHIDDRDISRLTARQLAQKAAAVLQDSVGDFDLQVRDVVAMGRAPFKRIFQRDNASDAEIIEHSLELVDATHLTTRPFAKMSGGERQRVLIARAIAQQPRLLVLDEPTNHLDIRHQFEVLALPATLGVTSIVALHDLNLAAHFCDRIYVLDRGRQMLSGTPEVVLTAELVANVYGVEADITINTRTGRPSAHFAPGRKSTGANEN